MQLSLAKINKGSRIHRTRFPDWKLIADSEILEVLALLVAARALARYLDFTAFRHSIYDASYSASSVGWGECRYCL